MVPTDWRLATLSPIHKKGDPEDVSNYRPVSLTSIICTIFERILKNARLAYLSETLSIAPRQHGFLPRRPCLPNVLVFKEVVTRMMDVDVIYLDFGKAFDFVNHRFLLTKMKSFGIGDVVVRWIEAYLFERVSRVQVGGEYSVRVVKYWNKLQASVVTAPSVIFKKNVGESLDRSLPPPPPLTEHSPISPSPYPPPSHLHTTH